MGTSSVGVFPQPTVGFFSRPSIPQHLQWSMRAPGRHEKHKKVLSLWKASTFAPDYKSHIPSLMRENSRLTKTGTTLDIWTVQLKWWLSLSLDEKQHNKLASPPWLQHVTETSAARPILPNKIKSGSNPVSLAIRSTRAHHAKLPMSCREQAILFLHNDTHTINKATTQMARTCLGNGCPFEKMPGFTTKRPQRGQGQGNDRGWACNKSSVLVHSIRTSQQQG